MYLLLISLVRTVERCLFGLGCLDEYAPIATPAVRMP